MTALVACGGGGNGAGDSGVDAQVDGPGTTCVRDPAPADRVRYVVVSHPYTSDNMRSNDWEVLELSEAGELSRPGRHFTMGRAFMGEVAFTRDGKIGLVAQEDGSVGIFALDDAGVPTVLHESFKGSFHAARVVVTPDDRIFVIDTEWREVGGGIYELSIDCDNVVTDLGLVAAAKLPAALHVTDSGHWIVAAADIGDSPMGADVHVVAPNGPSVIASSDAFADDMQIVGGATLTRDGSAFLVGDTSMFGDEPNRVAVVPVEGTQLGDPYVISNVEDPLALLASPFTDHAIVVSGFGNSVFTLAKTGNTWALTGEVSYVGAPPQLPGGAVMIEQGALHGLVLISELDGVRRVEMTAAGTIVDRGLYSLGGGANSPGAIGVTP